jgi:hypothetical protein
MTNTTDIFTGPVTKTLPAIMSEVKDRSMISGWRLITQDIVFTKGTITVLIPACDVGAVKHDAQEYVCVGLFGTDSRGRVWWVPKGSRRPQLFGWHPSDIDSFEPAAK